MERVSGLRPIDKTKCMEAAKILSANFLDVLFEDLNKEYGAYELRKTYNKRITLSLLITLFIGLFAFGASLLKGSSPLVTANNTSKTVVELSKVPDEEEEIEIIKPKEVEQVKSVQFTKPDIVPDNQVKPEDMPPDLTQIENSKIDIVTKDGADYDGIPDIGDIDGNTGVIQEKIETEDKPFISVQIEASFQGDWKRFLERNLNAQVAVDNGAAPGRYQVIIQFIVDREGNVSDMKPLTNFGFGMEEEAMRVLRKSPKWNPAQQQDKKVKAYKKQPVIFLISDNE